MHQLRRVIVAVMGGGLLSLALVGTAFAGIPDTSAEIHADGTHDATTTVCTFHVHFVASDVDPDESGNWEIWSTTGGGHLELSGEYAAPETIAPTSGAYELPEGMYELRWDDEPVDSSRLTVTFEVACDEQSTPPSSPPSTLPSTPPSEVPPSTPPTGSEAPTGSELPAGGAATPAPTLPPTDTANSLSGLAAVAPLLAVVLAIAGLLLMLGRPHTSEVRRNR